MNSTNHVFDNTLLPAHSVPLGGGAAFRPAPLYGVHDARTDSLRTVICKRSCALIVAISVAVFSLPSAWASHVDPQIVSDVIQDNAVHETDLEEDLRDRLDNIDSGDGTGMMPGAIQDLQAADAATNTRLTDALDAASGDDFSDINGRFQGAEGRLDAIHGADGTGGSLAELREADTQTNTRLTDALDAASGDDFSDINGRFQGAEGRLNAIHGADGTGGSLAELREADTQTNTRLTDALDAASGDDFSDINGRFQDAERDIDDLEAEDAGILGRLTAAEGEIREATDSTPYNNINERLNAIDGTSAEINGRLMGAETLIEGANGAFGNINDRLGAIDGMGGRLEGAENTILQVRNTLEGRLNDADGDGNTLEDTVTNLQDVDTATTARLNDADGDGNTLEDTVTNLQDVDTATTARLNDADGDGNTLEDTVTNLQDVDTATTARLNDADGDGNTLEDTVTNLQDVDTATTARLNDADGDGNTLEDTVTNLQDVDTATTARLNDADGDGNTLEDTVTNLERADFMEREARMGGDTALNTRITTEVDRLDGEIDRLDEGIAMATALSMMEVPLRHKFGLSLGVGHYQDKQAVALGVGFRPKKNLLIKVGGAYGFDSNKTAIGGSISIGF